MSKRALVKTLAGCSSLLSLVLALHTHAATLRINNVDPPGQGFNDPTPVDPVGGNPGTTRGEQALNVFRKAAEIWGETLVSNVDIVVRASFAPLACTSTGVVLGSTGLGASYQSDPSFPVQGVLYAKSLADAFRGEDFNPNVNDMNMTFNNQLGLPSCTAAYWYFGFDHQHGDDLTNDAIDMLGTITHEMGHGLNFWSHSNGGAATGIFDTFLLDTEVELHWTQLSPTERAASARKLWKLAWDGPNSFVTANVPNWLVLGEPHLAISEPPQLVGEYNVGEAVFGPRVPNQGVGAAVQLVNLDPTSQKREACEPPLDSLEGKIALIERGTCRVSIKTKNAQDAGAVGVLIIDNAVLDHPRALNGTHPGVTITALEVNNALGQQLKNALNTDPVLARFTIDLTQRAGAHYSDGRELLYSPNPFQSGSSVSHFDQSTVQTALMAPYITDTDGRDDYHRLLDNTTNLFRDIGWTLTSDAKVSMAISGGPTLVAGTLVSYMISVQNDGYANTDGLTLNGTAPTGLTFVSNTGDCSSAFPCNFGTVLPGVRKTVASTFRIASGYAVPGSLTNTVTVTSTTGDPHPDNNTAAITSSVTGSADAAVALTAPASATKGGNIQYSVRVTNAGPSDAALVALAASPPAGLTFVSNTGDCTTAFPCNFGTLAAGGSRNVVSTYSIPLEFAGASLQQRVSVSSSTSDPNAANNTSTASSSLNSGAAPTSTTISPDSGPLAGGTVVTINGTNFVGGDGFGVKFGGTTATAVTLVNGSTIQATTPARSAAGRVDVVVANPDGQATTLTNAFTYQDASSITTGGNNNSGCTSATADTFPSMLGLLGVLVWSWRRRRSHRT